MTDTDLLDRLPAGHADAYALLHRPKSTGSATSRCSRAR